MGWFNSAVSVRSSRTRFLVVFCILVVPHDGCEGSPSFRCVLVARVLPRQRRTDRELLVLQVVLARRSAAPIGRVGKSFGIWWRTKTPTGRSREEQLWVKWSAQPFARTFLSVTSRSLPSFSPTAKSDQNGKFICPGASVERGVQGHGFSNHVGAEGATD